MLSALRQGAEWTIGKPPLPQKGAPAGAGKPLYTVLIGSRRP